MAVLRSTGCTSITSPNLRVRGSIFTHAAKPAGNFGNLVTQIQTTLRHNPERQNVNAIVCHNVKYHKNI
jgi:hypothetical protein